MYVFPDWEQLGTEYIPIHPGGLSKASQASFEWSKFSGEKVFEKVTTAGRMRYLDGESLTCLL